MARYVDVDKAKEIFHNKTGGSSFDSFIDDAPTADVVEVRHGKWLPIVIQDNYLEPPYCDTIKCSECGQEADVSFHDAKYCFECGAKMDGGKAE
jgi:hypothetical protein